MRAGVTRTDVTQFLSPVRPTSRPPSGEFWWDDHTGREERLVALDLLEAMVRTGDL